MSTVTFNGYDLSNLIKVHWDIDPEILPAVDDRTTTVGDRNGSLFLHRRIGERVISMDYTMLNADEAKRQELTRVLNVSEPKQLILGKQPDRYYMAMPKGDISRGTKGWNDWSTIDWIVYEPYAHALTPTTATNMPWSGENLLVGTSSDKVTAKTINSWGTTDKTNIEVDMDALNMVDGVYTFSVMSYNPPFDAHGELAIIDANGKQTNISGSAVKAGTTGLSTGTVDFSKYSNIVKTVLHATPFTSSHTDDTDLDLTYSTPRLQSGPVDETGMNLIVNSTNMRLLGWTANNIIADWIPDEQNGGNILHMTATKVGVFGVYLPYLSPSANDKYISSIDVKGTPGLKFSFLHDGSLLSYDVQTIVSNDWQRHSTYGTYTVPKGAWIAYAYNAQIGDELYLRLPAIKRDTKDATYTSSPYDYVPNQADDNYYANTITLTNNGTVPTPVNIETEFDHDNGYFAASLDDRYYQIGHPDEIDVVDYKQNETLAHDSFNSDAELDNYTKNNALHRYNPSGTHQQGAFKTAVVGDDKRSVLQVSNTGTLVQGWQGPSLTRVIPKDSNGVLGVLNPALEVYVDFYATNNLQSGILEVNLTDANDKFVAGVLFRKPATSNKHIEVTFYAGDKEVWSLKNDSRLDNFRGRVSIYKFNNHFWFGLSKLERGKDNYTFSIPSYYDDTLKDLTATKYHIWASHWQDQKFMMIQIYDIKLTKQNVEKQANVANFFSPGDKLLINSSEYKAYINDVVDLDDVATGSKPLLLPANSTTTLALATSSFGHLRKVTVTYRERWI